MAVKVTQLERAYFIRKLGGTNLPEKRVTQIKREYFISQLAAGSAQNTLQQLEKLWLMKIITTAGLTVQNFNSIESLWQSAVLTLSLTPTNLLNDNKIKFYLNAP